jgi:hypothetical protein
MIRQAIDWLINLCSTEVKVAAFSGSSSLASIAFGWLNPDLIADTVAVALVSTAIGYYGTKLLKLLDQKVKQYRERKKGQ